MEPLFSDLYVKPCHCVLESKQLSGGGGIKYPKSISSTIKTRLSNSYLIGEIFGMLTFGFIIDKLGRRTGIVFATCFLILGIILATAAHGDSNLGCVYLKIATSSKPNLRID